MLTLRNHEVFVAETTEGARASEPRSKLLNLPPLLPAYPPLYRDLFLISNVWRQIIQY